MSIRIAGRAHDISTMIRRVSQLTLEFVAHRCRVHELVPEITDIVLEEVRHGATERVALAVPFKDCKVTISLLKHYVCVGKSVYSRFWMVLRSAR